MKVTRKKSIKKKERKKRISEERVCDESLLVWDNQKDSKKK